MRITITGSRWWTDEAKLRGELDRYVSWCQAHDAPLFLAHGACPTGDDKMVADLDKDRAHVEPYPADWSRYGKAAGPKRNRTMVDAEHTLGCRLLVAFVLTWSNGDPTNGTADCIRWANLKGWRVVMINGGLSPETEHERKTR